MKHDSIEKQLKRLSKEIELTAKIDMLEIQIFRMKSSIKTLESELEELIEGKKEEEEVDGVG